ncbi:hypothetical protein LSH36_125g01043 [Paralvinella palmiformis]|uniref:Ig-like domain-containing protein n=1 Tax=Paralvinella palmiformis TaxID=53620 RepID=A0AAD9JZ58_9ANNE|nr:hypothetical protein LSH36_125g01043 [Paralvinella palmiformis]
MNPERCDIGRLEKRGSTSLRRAASDVYGSSQYKTTASIQLQKTPAEAEDTVKGNSAALKAFHTERLKSALDFFRKKEEFNQSSKGTSPSRGRPLSLHASFSYDHHGNNLNASSSYQNGTTLAKFGNIVQRSSEPPESCKNRQPVDSIDDKTPTEKNTSSSQFRRMNASHSTTACKAGTNMNSVKTGVNPEANMKGRTNCVKVQVENDDSGFIGGLPTLEKLKRDIETYDKELHECDDYDKRRAFRAKIRDLRKQIKEEKYYKQEATSSASSDDILLATNLPHAYITGAVQSSKAATSSRAHPIIIEEPVSTDKANNIPETSTHRKLAVTNRGRHPAETNKYKKVDNDKDVTPQVIHKLEDQAVLDGQSCSFKCNISAPEGATIVWYHDSKLLESSDEIRQQFANGNAKLNIAEVFPDDEGENDCEMPEISVPLENQTCSEGDTITLTCSVCGKPKPLITWSRDGYPLFGAKRYIYKYDGQEAVLVINDAITGDGGSYTCEARSLAGSASSECIIDVKASPVKKPEFLVVLPSTHSVNQGRNLTLTCHVMGKPRPDVTWYHEARELTQCEQYAMNYEGDCVKLTLRNTTAGMAGSYSCLASNSSGDIRCITTVNVTGRTIEPGKPVFINPLSDVLVPDGTPSFTLKCSIEGRPRPVVLWQKGRDFLRTGSRYREKFDGREASLEIKQVNKSDTDSYTCVCRNEFGKVKSTCALTVQDSDKVLTRASERTSERRTPSQAEVSAAVAAWI